MGAVYLYLLCVIFLAETKIWNDGFLTSMHVYNMGNCELFNPLILPVDYSRRSEKWNEVDRDLVKMIYKLGCDWFVSY